MNKALVLNSGGVDSTTCVGLAVKIFGKDNVSTVSVFYGQKHKKELESAKKVAEYYDLKHYELDLSGVLKYSDCPLLEHSTQEIEHKSYYDQIHENGEGMVKTYVPFRNGLLLSSVASLAVSIYPEDNVSIYLGAHADDAAGNAYADCSSEFTETLSKAINIGTYEKVSIVAPFVGKHKKDIVELGLEIRVPYELTWSCYEGGEKACGTCGTCIDRLEAFNQNGVTDPIEYQEV